jgi:hypothetical protein
MGRFQRLPGWRREQVTSRLMRLQPDAVMPIGMAPRYVSFSIVASLKVTLPNDEDM